MNTRYLRFFCFAIWGLLDGYDLYSEHIQKYDFDKNILINFSDLVDDNAFKKEPNGDDIFRKNFKRFQLCSKDEVLKNPKTRLYRINNCSYKRLVSLPVSIDMYSQKLSTGQRNIVSSVLDINEDIELIRSSNLIQSINNILNKESSKVDRLKFEDFCKFIKDENLLSYQERNGCFEIEKYLDNYENGKIVYDSHKTQAIIGSIFLPQNKDNFLDWLHQQPNKSYMFWLPSSTKYWGSSVYAKWFYTEVNKKNRLSIVLPKPESYIKKDEYYNQYKKFNNKLERHPNFLYFENANPLNEMEILILPGSPCFAMVQYHVAISNSYGYSDTRIPVGYVTFDSVRVKMIWELLLRKLRPNSENRITSEDNQEIPNEILDCFSKTPNWA